MNVGVKVLEGLKTSSNYWNPLSVEESVDGVSSTGLISGEIVNDNFAIETKVIEDRLDLIETYLSQVLLVSRVIEQTLSILEQLISEERDVYKDTVLMDTVQYDIHKVGKNVCCFMLCGIGYKVIDLDMKIRLQAFIESKKEIDAEIFSCYTLMTSTLKIQSKVVKVVHDNNMFIAIIFGGSPYGQERVKKIGDDGYLSSDAEIIILISGPYTRRKRNTADRCMDVDGLRSHHFLSNIMILCSPVSWYGR